ncbi:hypothetical protein I6A84_37015 [Frankia sp. CNm7]|uniref:hypothetical protein n=1 Tax=Frankia nepalensis TaxID=1836974 RepID=UPI0019314FF0|nr:hypothetical protein [Frankia nepalensis]MBL7501326.1 hypothetical protein [Frankia nepalensis]MBL7510824.1 hypothetical protein [Frankia nepalensis]MBL7523503.1 hypothetical protein [Frankia nepalensis]
MTPKVSDAVAGDLDRRAAWREARQATRFSRRARWTAGCWAAFAAVSTPVGVAVGGADWWLWLATGAGALANGGLWAWQAARAERRNPGPPIPQAPAPSVRALSGSAAAGPLRRGEGTITAFLALSRPVPPGPTAEVIRSAMAAAAEVVDGLRLRAGRVVACEAAAKAVADPAGRAQLTATAKALVEEMTAAARALDDLVAATAEVVGAGVRATAGDASAGLAAGGAALGVTPVDLAGLAERAESLRGYAAALRDLSVSAPGLAPTRRVALPGDEPAGH